MLLLAQALTVVLQLFLLNGLLPPGATTVTLPPTTIPSGTTVTVTIPPVTVPAPTITVTLPPTTIPSTITVTLPGTGTGTSAGSTATPTWTGYELIYPCVVDNAQRILAGDYNMASSTNTPFNCVERCSLLQYPYAGVEYGDECHCGTGLSQGEPQRVNVTDCNMPCSGDAGFTCGAGFRMQVCPGVLILERTLMLFLQLYKQIL